jgi:hypothetical protein
VQQVAPALSANNLGDSFERRPEVFKGEEEDYPL